MPGNCSPYLGIALLNWKWLSLPGNSLLAWEWLSWPGICSPCLGIPLLALTPGILTAGAAAAPGTALRGREGLHLLQSVPGMGKCAQNQGETTTLPCPEQQAGLKPELAVGIHHQPHIQRPCSRFWLTQSAGAPSGEDEKQERSEQPGLCARERAGLGWAAPAQAVLRLHQFRDQLPTQSSPGSSFQHRTALCSLQAGQGFQQCHQSSWVGQKSFSFSVQRCLQHISSVMFNTQPGIHLPSRTGGAAGQRGTALDSNKHLLCSSGKHRQLPVIARLSAPKTTPEQESK